VRVRHTRKRRRACSWVVHWDAPRSLTDFYQSGRSRFDAHRRSLWI
jgi:hypothetical protein